MWFHGSGRHFCHPMETRQEEWKSRSVYCTVIRQGADAGFWRGGRQGNIFQPPLIPAHSSCNKCSSIATQYSCTIIFTSVLFLLEKTYIKLCHISVTLYELQVAS